MDSLGITTWQATDNIPDLIFGGLAFVFELVVLVDQTREVVVQRNRSAVQRMSAGFTLSGTPVIRDLRLVLRAGRVC